ncbi:MAG: 2-hydroxyacid dehydrogenase [Rhodobacteraceae bacterium]|nr:2-hydroxyacid dehydrogenase [Paracoccaceae bacterium]
MQKSARGLLLITEVTDRMRARLSTEFSVLDVAEIGVAEILNNHSEKIEAVMANGHDGIDPEIMTALPNLRVISCYGVGYEQIDAKSAAQRGIVVTHTPDVLNDEVANTAIMLLLGVARDFVANDRYIRAGRWTSDGNAPLSRSIRGLTVGILGLGRIGGEIAAKLGVFGCNIIYHSRSKKPVEFEFFADLEQMAQVSDALICITPGGPETRHLINGPVLEALGANGILINVSRGSVVDEGALLQALQNGRLGGAGLDVFEAEPVVPEAFFGMDNVILQPHVGSATVEVRRAMGDLACDNLSQFFRTGTVLTPVPECANLGSA